MGLEHIRDCIVDIRLGLVYVSGTCKVTGEKHTVTISMEDFKNWINYGWEIKGLTEFDSRFLKRGVIVDE